ncbi:MAG: hypothetical protein KDK62_05975 [Chlamydiia bacterium]|nr:hypothetical protein [Chlamydiia bacterium]
MKRYIFALPLLATLASCQNNTCISCEDEPVRPCQVVDETYVHKYGFEVAPDEWENRGEHGQKITTMDNGITCKASYSFGKLDGHTTYSFPYSSQVQVVRTYSQGELVAEENRFLGGTPKERTEFQSGNRKKVIHWYESGVPQCSEAYQADALIEGQYYTPANQVESQVAGGNGVRVNRDANGDLTSRDMIENGEMVERTSYYPNGTPSEMLPFRNNIVHGLRRTFLQGGEPKTVEEWQDGTQTGITVVYQNGEKYAEIPYENGRKHGIEKRYIDGQELFEEITWNDGHDTGQMRTFKVKRH